MGKEVGCIDEEKSYDTNCRNSVCSDHIATRCLKRALDAERLHKNTTSKKCIDEVSSYSSADHKKRGGLKRNVERIPKTGVMGVMLPKELRFKIIKVLPPSQRYVALVNKEFRDMHAQCNKGSETHAWGIVSW